jgi:hypothetical protein
MNVRFKANIVLYNILDTREPITSPARNYIHCLTRANECLYARNAILTKKIDIATKILSERKEWTSGKRKSIKGKYIMTGKELKSIRETEALTKQKTQRCLNEVFNRSSDGSIVLSNDIKMGMNH